MPKSIASVTVKALCTAALLATAGQALAEQAFVVSKVNRVLMTASNYGGGCVAELSVSPHTKLAGCHPGWVTFSCTGEFIDKVRAHGLASQAQVALASGKSVAVLLRDDKKHDGICFAYRIDVFR